jgi:hypothetical protein
VRTADIHRNDRIMLVLTVAAVLLGVSVFAKVAGFYVERERMQGMAGFTPADGEPNSVKERLGEAKKAADTLKQKNLFIQEPPKQHPVKQVDGILGNEVFIAGKWYKAGEKVGDATILEIRPTFVKVAWDGKETNFAPIGAASAGPPSPPPAAREPPKEAGPEPPKPAQTQPVKVETPAPVEDDPLAWLGVKLSPRMRAILLEKWSHASDEEKARAQEEWNKMSDDQKQQAIDQMERHM